MKKMILFALVFTIAILKDTKAQQGFGTSNPNPKAVVDMVDPNKGVLLPRVALAGTTDVVTIPSPVNALTVFNTATVNDVSPGYYYYSTAEVKWVRLLTSETAGWKTTGNLDITKAIHFLGTLGDVPLVFKVNNEYSGIISSNSSVGFTAFGYKAGSTMINNVVNSLPGQSTGITTIGHMAGAVTNGVSNTFIGSYSGVSSLGPFQGGDNTFVGTYSGYNNTIGSRNVFLGVSSGDGNISANDNIAIGHFSGRGNQTGLANISLGSQTNKKNTAGSRNVAIGYNAYGGESGSSNIAIGYYVMNPSIINGSTVYASGSFNIGIGDNVLANATTATSNIIIGYRAGRANKAGSNNVGLGDQALITNVTGNNNVVIGYNADVTIDGLNNAIAIGANAKVAISNSMVLGGTGTSALSVGIGTTSPAATFHIVKKAADITPAIIENCPVFADNDSAIAAGIPMGGLYRTADGTLKIRF